jgi:hypothetical protein
MWSRRICSTMSGCLNSVKKLLCLVVFLLSGCLALPTPEPTATVRAPQMLSPEENPYAPQLEDVKLIRAGIILTSINLSERTDLNPARIGINLLGSMPSTCNQLRLQVNPPDKEYRIYVEAYSLIDPKKKCENVFQQFETNIMLGVYAPGRYTIWVNDVFIGDFTSY